MSKYRMKELLEIEARKESCVTINVYVKCDKEGHPYTGCPETWEKKDDTGCVDINVFVECDKEKK